MLVKTACMGWLLPSLQAGNQLWLCSPLLFIMVYENPWNVTLRHAFNGTREDFRPAHEALICTRFT